MGVRAGAVGARVLVAQSCPTLCDPTDCQAPLFMGFAKQEYWSGLPFPSLLEPGASPNELLPLEEEPPLEKDSRELPALINWKRAPSTGPAG